MRSNSFLFSATVNGGGEQSSSIPPKSKGETSEIAPIEASGSPESVKTAEETYLERKANAAAGIWGRVVESPTGCWEWQGAKNAHGYGVATVAQKQYLVHRLILELVDGSLGAHGLACHSCNNPSCVNPRHLVAGTALDNAHDYVESKRRPRPRKMNNAQVDEAFALYAGGEWTLRALASRYGVTASSVHRRLKARGE